MKPMNGILADIVVASGGTVTAMTRNGLIQDWLNAVSAPVARYFTTFDPVLNTRMTLQTPKVIAGDFDLSYVASSTDLTRDMGLEDSTKFSAEGLEGQFLLYIDNPDGLQLLIGNADTNFTRYIFGGHALIINGKLNLISISRRAGVITANLNGVRLGGSTTDTRNLLFEGNIGGGYGRFFNGVIANVTLTDLTNPSNSESWKLDRPIGTNTEQSSSGNNLLTYVNATNRELFTKVGNDWLGAELFVNPVAGATWAHDGNGVYSINGTGAYNTLYSIITSGFRYKTKYNLDSFNGGLQKLSVRSTDVIQVTSTVGAHEVIHTATATQLQFVRFTTDIPWTATISGISNKRILEVA